MILTNVRFVNMLFKSSLDYEEIWKIIDNAKDDTCRLTFLPVLENLEALSNVTADYEVKLFIEKSFFHEAGNLFFYYVTCPADDQNNVYDFYDNLFLKESVDNMYMTIHRLKILSKQKRKLEFFSMFEDILKKIGETVEMDLEFENMFDKRHMQVKIN